MRPADSGSGGGNLIGNAGYGAGGRNPWKSEPKPLQIILYPPPIRSSTNPLAAAPA
jgi:hypothetical protein